MATHNQQGADPGQPAAGLDLALMDRMIPPLNYPPWAELNAAWKRMRPLLTAPMKKPTEGGPEAPETAEREKKFFKWRMLHPVTGAVRIEYPPDMTQQQLVDAICMVLGNPTPREPITDSWLAEDVEENGP